MNSFGPDPCREVADNIWQHKKTQGEFPTKLILTQEAHDELASHPAVCERIKYSAEPFPPVSDDLLSSLLSPPGVRMEIKVPKGKTFHVGFQNWMVAA